MDYVTDEQYAIALESGIRKATVYNRVYTYGWDVEKAITLPTIPRELRARKFPKKYTDLALSNGICLETFYLRMRKGWTCEEASTVKPRAKRELKGE